VYGMLVRLMLLVAVAQLGMSLADFRDCRRRLCLQKIEKRWRDVLKIDWRPISIFPEEAKRFNFKRKTKINSGNHRL
jgi:hypothetical protein